MLGPLASMGLLVVKMMLLLLRAHFLPSPSRSSLLFSPYVTIMTLQCALTMTIDMKVNLLCISSKRSNSQSCENWVVLFNHICLVLACSIVHFIGSIVMNLSRNLGLQKGFVKKKVRRGWWWLFCIMDTMGKLFLLLNMNPSSMVRTGIVCMCVACSI